MLAFGIFFGVLLFLLIIFLAQSIYLVRQAESIIVERLGRFHKILTPGIHWVMPFLETPRQVTWSMVKEVDGKRYYRFTNVLTPAGVTWVPRRPRRRRPGRSCPAARRRWRCRESLFAGAAAGDAAAALAALAEFRLLCAHRRGPYGAASWMRRVEGWLAAELPGFGAAGEWYAGRPLLVTENDYGLRLYNGDTGVVVATARRARGGVRAPRRGMLGQPGPARRGRDGLRDDHPQEPGLPVRHRRGGAAAPTSPILTRELLYTAVTPTSERVILVGNEAAVRAAVARPVARASGLRARLWGDPPDRR